MLKLLKYLKPFIVGMIAIFVLLFVQAMTDLALPDFMSDIVDKGISRGGVESNTPVVVRESEMDRLLLFMTTNQKDQVLKNYQLVEPDKADYPKANEKIYKLKDVSKEKTDQLGAIFGEKIMMLMGIQEQGIPSASGEVIKGEQAIQALQAIAKQSPEQLQEMQKQAEEQIDKMPEMVVDGAAVQFIQAEYKAVGLDTDKIQMNYMLKIGALMLGVTLLGGLCAVVVSYISAKVGTGFARDLRSRVFRKVGSFSNTEFDKFSTASLITRTTNDIVQIQNLMIMILRILFYAPIMAIGGIYKVLQTDTSMSWITALAIGALLALILFLFKVGFPKFRVVQKLTDKINLISRENLTGLLVVRAFNTEKHEQERFDDANKELTRVNLFINRVMQVMWPIMMLIMNGSSILIIWVGSHQVSDGAMQVGSMMAYMQYTIQIIFAFLMVSAMFIMIPRASVSAGRIAEVLAIEPTIVDAEQLTEFDTTQKGVVEFKNVTFRYPNAEGRALKNISFKTKPGKITAIIGSTGSGKTTLVNMIPRFYDVTEGAVLVDGVDIRQVPQKALRDKIGYVPQKGMLFTGTIASNLQFAKEDASIDEMKQAASIAQATDFIENKEEGYQSAISQGGTNVSGGQRQRLSIARALVKKPEIYIFDDSFSALDFKTDAALRKALGEEMKDATLIIVAQRVSTIMHADQIMVMEDGEVVGIGTHDELMKTCEIYQDIAMSQLSKEELGHE